MGSYDKLLDLRPENAVKILGSSSKLCLLSGADIFGALRDKKMIVLACNPRIKHSIPGLMRAAKELDAVIGFELAKSESDLTGGYTGFTPKLFMETIIEYARQEGYDVPFFVHADHTTVKENTEEAIESARALNAEQLRVGYTSFAIDASFNPIEDNIRITCDLAKQFEGHNVGLEVEVGEIRSIKDGGSISTVEDAVQMIDGVMAKGIKPHLIALNNGSVHGNYKPGQKVHIELERTGEIHEAIKNKGVDIAQHGITGTPLDQVGQFADYGIRKGNVATQWQNIVHAHLPEDLAKQIKDWTEDESKHVKQASKQFKDAIDNLPAEYVKKIVDQTHKEAKEYIEAFRAKGSAATVAKHLLG